MVSDRRLRVIGGGAMMWKAGKQTGTTGTLGLGRRRVCFDFNDGVEMKRSHGETSVTTDDWG